MVLQDFFRLYVICFAHLFRTRPSLIRHIASYSDIDYTVLFLMSEGLILGPHETDL